MRRCGDDDTKVAIGSHNADSLTLLDERRLLDRKQPPLAGDALQSRGTTFAERDSGYGTAVIPQVYQLAKTESPRALTT